MGEIEKMKAQLLAGADAADKYASFVGRGVSKLVREATDYNGSKIQDVLSPTLFKNAIEAIGRYSDRSFTHLSTDLPPEKANELGIADFINEFNGRGDAIHGMCQEAIGHLASALSLYEQIHPELFKFDETKSLYRQKLELDAQMLRMEADLL